MYFDTIEVATDVQVQVNKVDETGNYEEDTECLGESWTAIKHNHSTNILLLKSTMNVDCCKVKFKVVGINFTQSPIYSLANKLMKTLCLA